MEEAIMKSSAVVKNISIVGIFVISAEAAVAAGYQIQEQSVKGLGNAFAGGSAVAEDASTSFYNPAGLTRLQSRQVELATHIIVPRGEFKDSGSTNAVDAPAIGSEDETDEIAAVPNFFYANPINEKWTFGFGITTPYGLVTEYDNNWIGRYHAVKSELVTVNINPSLGFRVNNQLSLGVGVSAQYADAELSNAIDFGTLGFGLGAPVTPSTPAFDGFTRVEGDDWGVGFNAGVLYEFSETSRIGLAYRSEIDHTLKGDNRVTVPDILVPRIGPSFSRGASADVTIPSTLSLSAYHRIDERWAIMADVTWTDWSVFDELRIEFEDGRESVQPENWDDAYRYSIGTSYYYDDHWTLRAGLAYDETPIPSAGLRTPRIPDNSRRWVTLGASYRLSDRFSFDIAYAHIFISDSGIANREEATAGLTGNPDLGSTLHGEYESSVDLISAQIQWNF
jgi:long-chain fatty acid transport protein